MCSTGLEARKREDREREDRWRERMEEREVRMNERLMEQMECYRKKKWQDQRRKLEDKMEPWKDNDHPTSYLKRFEDVMTDAGIPCRVAKQAYTSTHRKGTPSIHK